MKKLILVFLAIILVVCYSNEVEAQTTANTTNDAKCTIIAPLAIAEGVTLEFGDIIKGAGDVTVGTDGVRTIPAALLSGTQLGLIRAATFTVTGESTYTYAITLPADNVVTITQGSDPMDVNSFTASTSSDGAGLEGTLDGSNEDVISVGATLTVAADQAVGDYTGSFTVSVAYN